MFLNDENRVIFETVRDTGRTYIARAREFEYPGQPERADGNPDLPFRSTAEYNFTAAALSGSPRNMLPKRSNWAG